jgi:chromate reductase
MGASVGATGTARAQYHLRQTFVFLNMHAENRPEVMISNAVQRFDGNGRLVDPTSRKLVEQLVGELVAAGCSSTGTSPSWRRRNAICGASTTVTDPV